jgi:hypothetical protein
VPDPICVKCGQPTRYTVIRYATASSLGEIVPQHKGKCPADIRRDEAKAEMLLDPELLKAFEEWLDAQATEKPVAEPEAEQVPEAVATPDEPAVAPVEAPAKPPVKRGRRAVRV